MPTLLDPNQRAVLLRRIDALRPDLRPAWGRMTAPEMVAHLTLAITSCLEGGPVRVRPSPLSRFPINWLVINVLPWPKGKVQAPAELLAPAGAVWSESLAELRAATERFAAKEPAGGWPPSPVFGSLTRAGWGALLAKHMDHHLRQFGV